MRGAEIALRKGARFFEGDPRDRLCRERLSDPPSLPGCREGIRCGGIGWGVIDVNHCECLVPSYRPTATRGANDPAHLPGPRERATRHEKPTCGPGLLQRLDSSERIVPTCKPRLLFCEQAVEWSVFSLDFRNLIRVRRSVATHSGYTLSETTPCCCQCASIRVAASWVNRSVQLMIDTTSKSDTNR